ncbi:ATP-binding cassette domain-containing protein [Robertkochia aurantiaca]|uniref:ATP-binding cassette domain-containing protein n=1 Tax=Robertkochia aurantiaca TaxID=2873700 RepID=UPI001CC9C8B2|nr:ATP-binding cassette domain-containing protein [Robertkochia sp. 3YJGBD-33]
MDHNPFGNIFNVNTLSDLNHLHIDSIQMRFGNKLLLSDIYLACKKGEILGILGRNGSGKSTLLKIIHKSLTAENRFVRAGKHVLLSEAATIRHLAYLPQENFLPGHLKIIKAIRAFVPPENLDKVINLPSVKASLNKKPYEISKGTQRFIETVITIHAQQDYILLDEPFAGNSPVNCEILAGLIKEQRSHKGFIITDHNYRTVYDIATRIVLLHHGSIKQITERNDLVRWGYLPG